MFLNAGIIGCFLSVAFGAFGAHALKAHLDEYHLGVFKTGVEYQFFHSLGLILVSLLFSRGAAPQFRWAGFLFMGGLFLFSGSLYLLAITRVKMWGAVTPLGGVAFLLGWLALLWGSLKNPL